MTEPLLRLTGVSRTYDDGVPVYALRETDVTIASGDFVTITGQSGSGKSTFLNVLGLLDRPTTGSYRVCGAETVRAPERLRVAVRGQLFGFVFQAFHLLAGRSVVDNVELGMLYGPHPPRVRRAMAAAAVERIGLSPRAHADPRTLSGGERQRVAIARAIAARPRVLFCDEPTGNLDSANTDNVLGLLAELNADGLTVVVVTHETAVAERGDRRLRVCDGVVEEVTGCPV
ncbi:ABC transporter ATP-binding protein [Actinophytocola sp.]|uniref:ABC transporter ATP-binding protein n=1 Tax=Actinophytocola sp. TaxID=1872138 RepID=UPI002ED6656D